jgi:hypothetical protein
LGPLMLVDYAVAVSVDVLQLMCKFPSSSYNTLGEERERKKKEKKRTKNNSNSRYTNLQWNTMGLAYIIIVVNEVYVLFLTVIFGFTIVCSLKKHICWTIGNKRWGTLIIFVSRSVSFHFFHTYIYSTHNKAGERKYVYHFSLNIVSYSNSLNSNFGSLKVQFSYMLRSLRCKKWEEEIIKCIYT